MNKSILITAIICLYSSTNFAQSFTVSGNLQDADGNGVPYASISLSEQFDTATIQFTIAKKMVHIC